jgi:hypothetical protein
MPKITEIKIDPPKILLYGPPSSGKSIFTGTGGEAVQFLDLDHNLRGLLNLKDKWQEKRRSCDVIECRDTSTGPGAFLKAKDSIISVANQCHSGKYPFKVFAIDSLTVFGESSLRQVMQGSPKQPTQQQWGLAIMDVEECLRILKGLPICVILIAHQTVEEIDGTNKTTVNCIGQKLPRSLPAYFDEIWYSKVIMGPGNTKQFVIQTSPSAAVIARSGGQLQDQFNQDLGLQEALKRIGYEI